MITITQSILARRLHFKFSSLSSLVGVIFNLQTNKASVTTFGRYNKITVSWRLIIYIAYVYETTVEFIISATLNAQFCFHKSPGGTAWIGGFRRSRRRRGRRRTFSSAFSNAKIISVRFLPSSRVRAACVKIGGPSKGRIITPVIWWITSGIFPFTAKPNFPTAIIYAP